MKPCMTAHWNPSTQKVEAIRKLKAIDSEANLCCIIKTLLSQKGTEKGM